MPLIGEASAINLGAAPVGAVYARGAKVWPTKRWAMDSFGEAPLTVIDESPVPGSCNAAWMGNGILQVTMTNTGIPNFYTVGWPAVPVEHPSGLSGAAADTTGWRLIWSLSLGDYSQLLGDLRATAWWATADPNNLAGGSVGVRALDGAPSSDGALLPWEQLTPTDVRPADMALGPIAGQPLAVGRWMLGVYATQAAELPPVMVATLNTKYTAWEGFINT